MTQLTNHFSLHELVRSSTAARQGIDNTPSPQIIENLRKTATVLENIRAHLSSLAGRDIPIRVTSGYRSLKLNRAIGSKDTSDHTRGLAVDFQADAFGTPYEVCRALAPTISRLGIGQIIHEYGDWIHVGLPVPKLSANRIITISRAGTQLGIQEA